MFAYYFRNLKRIESDMLKGIMKSFFILLVCSFTYYAFHINSILLAMVLFLALTDKIIGNYHMIHRKHHVKKVKFGVFLMSVLCFLFVHQKHDAISQWKSLKHASYFGTDGMTLPNVGKIASELKNDGKFLAEYGNYLYEVESEPTKAIEIMERSKKNFISKTSMENLAYLYLEHKEYDKAIEHFEWLVGFTPSRFGYRLELIRLYEMVHDVEKANREADFALNMPIKIPSSEVFAIKKEIAEIKKRLSIYP